MAKVPFPEGTARVEYRSVETFDELVGRGLSTLEALGVWLHEREGYAQLRPSVRGLVVCFVRTPWHALAVPATSFERSISAACRRVDELLKADFAHLEEPESSLLDRGADIGPEIAAEEFAAQEFTAELIPEEARLDLSEGQSSEEDV